MTFDPFAPRFLADPYPAYAQLRREAPCHHETSRDVWMVTRHADVIAVLRSPSVFSSAQGAGLMRVDDPERGGILVSTDPPRHTSLRRVVQRAFTDRIEDLAPRVDALVDRAVGAGEIDAIRDLAEPLPVAVTASLLGLQPDDTSSFAGWSDAIFQTMGPLDASDEQRVGGVIEAMLGYLMPIIESRRFLPGGLADTLMANAARGAMTRGEAVSAIVSVFAAGIDTTLHALGNGLAALAEHPAQWDALRAEPSLIPSAVEEILRFDAPVQAFFRTATVDAVIAGVTVPAGARVMAIFGSANRDPDRYERADALDVSRTPTDQLAFGAGAHLCLGAPLARMELHAMLRALARRVVRIEWAGTPTRRDRAVVRGFAHVPLRLVP